MALVQPVDNLITFIIMMHRYARAATESRNGRLHGKFSLCQRARVLEDMTKGLSGRRSGHTLV